MCLQCVNASKASGIARPTANKDSTIAALLFWATQCKTDIPEGRGGEKRRGRGSWVNFFRNTTMLHLKHSYHNHQVPEILRDIFDLSVVQKSIPAIHNAPDILGLY